MKILVIAAHPDDEVLGCGGTMARLASEGHDVHCLIVGEGHASRYQTKSRQQEIKIQKLHNQSKKAGLLLGCKDVFNHSFPDNRFDSVPLIDLVKLIEKYLIRIKPEMIFTQHGGDLNIDHQRVFQATLIATRPMKGSHSISTVYAYEVASSTEWSFQKFHPVFNPNVFFDISKTLNKKLRAMELYSTESRYFPHPRSSENLTAIAKRWGATVGVRAAEAFQLIREIN